MMLLAYIATQKRITPAINYQGCRQLDNWRGVNIYIFKLTDFKKNRFGEKLTVQDTKIIIRALPLTFQLATAVLIFHTLGNAKISSPRKYRQSFDSLLNYIDNMVTQIFNRCLIKEWDDLLNHRTYF